jgi:crotonobetainyl-CoA:carnitine CoA-transferase CaiB-like acyl-CoA transferase
MSHHRKPYKTKDGYISVLPYMNNHWKIFCEKAERHDLIDDERFKDLSSRVTNIDDTYSETGKILATKTTQEWLDILEETKVPAIEVNSLDDLFTDPHLDAVGFWKEVDHPSEGKLKMPGFPARFSKTPASIRKHAPKLGEHSLEILEEAGIDNKTINEMIDSKATVISD